MDGKGFTSSTSYRYGFNGQEKDNEISGNGNSTIIMEKQELLKIKNIANFFTERGIVEATILSVRFYVNSKEKVRIYALKQELEKLNGFKITIEDSTLFDRSFKLKGEIYFGELKKNSSDNYYFLIGWLYSICGDYYCTLAAVGLDI